MDQLLEGGGVQTPETARAGGGMDTLPGWVRRGPDGELPAGPGDERPMSGTAYWLERDPVFGRWLEALDSGDADSMREIADEMGVPRLENPVAGLIWSGDGSGYSRSLRREL